MGSVRVHVPASLRQYWGGPSKVDVEARSVREALAALGPLASRVLDDAGVVRRHVSLFVDQARVVDIDAPIPGGAVLHILPAVSGGLS